MNKAPAYTLITGGTSGIGYELAKIFAANGHNLVIVARNNTHLYLTKEELQLMGIKVVTISKDLCDPRAPFELYDELQAQHISIDILVNNAGQGQYGQFADTDIYRDLSIIQLNISSLVALTKLFLKDMLLQKQGRILNVSSLAAITAGPSQCVYQSTKAFVHSFTMALHNEMSGSGVTLTTLLPGPTDTDFLIHANLFEFSTIHQGYLADPAKVAADAYKGLMNGEEEVISVL